MSVCVCVCVHIYISVIYQHEVDVEVEDLVAHVHTEVVAEMVSQVGESPSRALEVGTRHLHPLDTKQRVSGTVWTRSCLFWVCVCVSYLLRHPVIHGSQHGVQGPYRESRDKFNEVCFSHAVNTALLTITFQPPLNVILVNLVMSQTVACCRVQDMSICLEFGFLPLVMRSLC